MNDAGSDRSAAVATAWLLCVLAVAGLAVAGGAVGDASAQADEAVNATGVNETAEGEDEPIVRHQNPDEYAESGDLEGLESALAERLAERLAAGALDADDGEYELALERLDEEFLADLDRYAEIAAETGNDEYVAAFEEARADQVHLVETLQAYEETSDAYEDARERGDDERMDELARELDELAVELEETREGLDERYEGLESGVGVDLSGASESVSSVNERISDDHEEIRAEHFVATALSVTVENDAPADGVATVSFLEPLEASGVLQTADGTPVANEEIELAVGNGTVETETDAGGAFEFVYRPTTENVSATSLEVVFVPERTSEYLESRTSVEVGLEQADAEVRSLEVPDVVAYDETVAVRGDLVVEGIPVDGVPLAVSLDGQEIGAGESEAGTINATGLVPASVPHGERDLRVGFDESDRALSPVSESASVTVLETATDLTVDARETDEGLRLSGRLTEADGGAGIANQTVGLVVDGAAVSSVTTDASGRFDETVAGPADASTASVEAVFEESRSNLAPASAEATVTLAGGEGATLADDRGTLVGAGVALAALTGVTVVLYRRRSQRAADSSNPFEAVRTATTADEEDGRPSLTPAYLARASDHLADGHPNAAAESCYAAVRFELSERLEDAKALTHWEFYEHYRRERASDGPDDVDRLRDVTQRYERAVFAIEDLTQAEATTVLELTRELCGLEREEPTAQASADD
ncbi:peptide chain release factor 1 [Natronobiforma cellulositropha]|uniref:hypothetical protein n=1 Tax=Natronobiforma cellulositropha TaxID=1679076 RepID=UPI0021D5B24C|nr:hypothetical protein [Natronobiforma cellulositropha]